MNKHLVNPINSHERPNILIVDDTLANLRLLTELLLEQGYKVRPASSARLALMAVQKQEPDLILLDIQMPGMNGYDVCRELKANENTRHIPIIFISAMNEVLDKVEAFAVGGVDYITKPFHTDEVLARINTHLSLRSLQKRLQKKNAQLQLLFEAEHKAKETAETVNVTLRALNDVAFAVNNSLDLQADLAMALEVVLNVLELDQAWLFVPEADGQQLRLVAALGLPDDFYRQEALTSIDQCACGTVLNTNKMRTHFETDICRRLLPYKEQDPALSTQHISLPVMAKQKIVGVLNLGGINAANLTPNDHEWLEIVTHQIGNAIENTTLYQNTVEEAKRLTVLNRVSSIISYSWQLDGVLPPLLSEVARVLEMDLGVVVLRSGEGQDGFNVRTRFGPWQFQANLNQVAWHKLPLLKIIAQTRSPLLIPNPGQDERLKPLSSLIAQEDIKTVLALPLVVQNQLTGFIQLYAVNQKRAFGAPEVELARTFTNQAAVAVEKARLYEATVTRYEEELKIARQIQQNLLPRIVPEVPGLRIAGLCQPAYATGGDFYDYILLPDNRLGIVVGDVTGKSLPAAMVMALARNTVRSELVNTPLPAQALTAANRWLCQDIRRGTFVAIVEVLIAPLEQRMILAHAGQTATILVRQGQITYLLPDGAAGFPLGIQQSTIYTQTEVSLQSGDTLLFYTDGIVEAKNKAGTMFGFERLETTMQTLYAHNNPKQIIDKLMAEMHTFIGEAEQHDDITLVVVQVE